MARSRMLGAACVALVAMLPLPAVAQQASGIAGQVRDTMGAVLPGVTVEATSPVLIEKVRTVLTDGQGYNVVDLRPGNYMVTFTRAGFNTVRREGIVLTGGFTATVDAEMRVGELLARGLRHPAFRRQPGPRRFAGRSTTNFLLRPLLRERPS